MQTYKEFIDILINTKDKQLILLAGGILSTINDIMIKIPENTKLELVIEQISNSEMFYVYYKVFKEDTILKEQVCTLGKNSKQILMGLSDICSFIFSIT